MNSLDFDWLYNDIQTLFQSGGISKSLLHKLDIVLNDRSLDKFEPRISELRKAVEKYAHE